MRIRRWYSLLSCSVFETVSSFVSPPTCNTPHTFTSLSWIWISRPTDTASHTLPAPWLFSHSPMSTLCGPLPMSEGWSFAALIFPSIAYPTQWIETRASFPSHALHFRIAAFDYRSLVSLHRPTSVCWSEAAFLFAFHWASHSVTGVLMRWSFIAFEALPML